MRTVRLLLALGAVLAAATALVACGGGVPGNAVASVGSQPITRTDFDHWMRIAALSSAQGSPAGASAVPQPPKFTSCIAQKRQALPKPKKGQPAVTDSELRAQCQQEYNQLRDQVLSFLISARWIQGEAADQGVKVSDKQVNKQFQQIKQQNFPKQAQFQKFLQQTGETQGDVLFRIRLNALSTALRQKVSKGGGSVTQAQIAKYYGQHKSQFGQPQRRNLRVVLAKTQANAQAALKALSSGQSFSAVAKKYSIDPASKNNGGQLLGVVKGQQEPSFDKAIFSAPVGKLEGPVKTQFGWYVFKVQKVLPASQQSLAQATPTIRQTLVALHQQQQLNSFINHFRKKWTGKTQCRTGYVTSSCANAPKAKKGKSGSSTTGTTSTGG